jgi:ArsR family transcriptional regulator
MKVPAVKGIIPTIFDGRASLASIPVEETMATRTVPLERHCCDDTCMQIVAHTRFDEPQIEQQATGFGAVGDEIRLKIIHLLAQHDALCVCEIQRAFELEQPTISHHLRVLRDANLVDVERRGTWAYYSLRRDALKRLTQQLVAAL